ncbi:MAG: hypothetical protein R2755_28105 [Acidimicrobiales bacterium]
MVLDLMIHDLDIISALAGCRAVDVAATTQRRKSPTDDLVSAVLRFENGLTASKRPAGSGRTRSGRSPSPRPTA